MSEEVKVSRTVFGKNTFQNVIKTKFTQLVPTTPSVSEVPVIGVTEFFQYYNELFYDIPSSGSFSGSLGLSHLDLINRSSDYIGISILDMQQEITDLRSENVALQRQIFTLTQTTGSNS